MRRPADAGYGTIFHARRGGAWCNTMKKKTSRKRARDDADFLARQVDAVATIMWALAERMEYYGGLDAEMTRHAREMAGASVIAQGWAKAIRGKNRRHKCRAKA